MVAATTRTSTSIGRTPPTRSMRALLQHAQELHLHLAGELADLVEEQGAAVRELEATGLLRDRAGERAALVAEELALEQVLRGSRRS